MKISLCIFIFITSSLFGSLAQAKSERAAGDNSRCIPTLPIEQAIEMAKKYLSKTSNSDEHFIDSILLQCQQSEAVWKVGWRRKAYQSGQLLMYIHKDGSIQESILKDG